MIDILDTHFRYIHNISIEKFLDVKCTNFKWDAVDALVPLTHLQWFSAASQTQCAGHRRPRMLLLTSLALSSTLLQGAIYYTIIPSPQNYNLPLPFAFEHQHMKPLPWIKKQTFWQHTRMRDSVFLNSFPRSPWDPSQLCSQSSL